MDIATSLDVAGREHVLVLALVLALLYLLYLLYPKKKSFYISEKYYIVIYSLILFPG